MSNKRNLYTILILLPIFEMINQILISTKINFNLTCVIGMILTLFMFLYLLFKSTSKYKTISIIFIVLLTLLTITLNNSLIILEFPILLIGLINYFNDKRIDKNEIIRIINYSTILYSILLFVLIILKKETIIISLLLISILPFIFRTLREGKYKRSIIITLIILLILTTNNIFTTIGVIVDLTLLLMFGLFNKDKKIKTIITLSILLIMSILYVIIFNVNLYNLKTIKIPLLLIVLYLMPILPIIYRIIKNKTINTNTIYYIVMFIMTYTFVYLNWNVINISIVNIYITLYIILFYSELNLINKREYKLEKNKITIYALHLNYGGIEKSICTKANILSEKYKVEIISLYKITNKPAFNLNKNIEVKYLLENLKPNKEEFIKSIKSLNLFKIIKESFYVIKVLYLKDTLINKSMINCNSEIIISTRIDFSEKLIKYNEYNSIKIAEEHIYHNNNKKYLKRLKSLLNKIDYLMPSSDYLTNYYKDLYIKNRYKIYTNKMPIKTDNKISTLKNKNIIAVGRLSKEKGFDDLIDIFSKSNHEGWALTIVGEGNEYSKLNAQINKLNLTESVKLVGKKNTEELNKLYRESSLYIMTSHEESFGLVLIEAASHGLPILAYSSALGAVEILKNKKGILVDNRNQRNMIKYLNEFLNDKELLKKYQKESLEIYEEYEFKKIQKEILNFYKSTKKNLIYTSLYKDTKEKCLKLIESKLENKEKTFIITANAETYMLSEVDPEINDMINNQNNIVVPDGIGVVKTARYIGIDIKERIPGIDIAEHLLKIANEKKYKVYLFGATIEVIEKLSKDIEIKYPNIDLVGASNGYIKDKDTVMNFIKTTKPDIVMVALGIPNQEKLINKHIKDFEKGIFIGVGGSFDVMSGLKKRAPEIFIKLNLEWLYRITLEPKRIKRFLKYNVKLITKIAKEKKVKRKTKKKQ